MAFLGIGDGKDNGLRQGLALRYFGGLVKKQANA